MLDLTNKVTDRKSWNITSPIIKRDKCEVFGFLTPIIYNIVITNRN